MKRFYFTRLLRGVLLISLTLILYSAGVVGAEDYSVYNSDNKQVPAVYINEDVYIVNGSEHNDSEGYGRGYNGAVTSLIPVEIRGYTSREPGKYPGEGKIDRLDAKDYEVDTGLTGNPFDLTGPSWFSYYWDMANKTRYAIRQGQRTANAGIAYRLHVNPTWLNGRDDDTSYIYADPDTSKPRNYVKLDNNTWQIRVPGFISFFKYGDLPEMFCCGDKNKTVSLPLDLAPDIGMLEEQAVTINYFGQNNTMIQGGPGNGGVNISIYIIGNIHFANRKQSVQITGSEITTHFDEITSRDSDAIGTILGKPVPATLSFPFTSTDAITSLRLSNASDSRKIKGIRVFNSNVMGIGYQITDKDGKELSPASAVVQDGNLTVPVNLTFIKTGEIMPGSKVTKLENMGKLMVITGRELKDRVLYEPDKPLIFDGNAKIIVPALGCD